MKKRRDHHVQQRYDKERQRNVMAKPGVHQFCLVLDHLKPFFNPPKIFRSAEAFGAAAVHLVGIGVFDPSPAKGSFRKVPARFHDDFASCYEQLVAADYTLYCLEPNAQQSLCNCDFPEKTAFILGHEEFGFSFDSADYPDIRCISIPQYGSVQSLNVSIAASIVMFEYVRQQLD
ncbi:MAG TPA: TrmH family RNA methyltransferase [Geopsychrobacteraceae bacterium]|nr:TrmH family RNA methyltransferase [Geopsychrobacteraceae bacterium]